MHEDFFFLRENVVDVDAAVVGISKSRWTALSHEVASLERAQEVMRQHQFDVLPIRIFIFNLVGELEIRLSEMIRSRMSEQEIIDIGIKEEVSQLYFSDKERGLEPDLMEYLYLSDLINIIAKKHLYGVLGYPSRKTFEKSLGPINNLRNEAAHPTRSLITDANAVDKLWNKVETIEHNLFRLRQVG